MPIYSYRAGTKLQGSVDNTDLFDVVGRALRVTDLPATDRTPPPPAAAAAALCTLTDPGSTTSVAGPFEDRVQLSRLHCQDGQVSGAPTVTSDVSDLSDLQVLAGFHDVEGGLLDTGRFVPDCSRSPLRSTSDRSGWLETAVDERGHAGGAR